MAPLFCFVLCFLFCCEMRTLQDLDVNHTDHFGCQLTSDLKHAASIYLHPN